VEYGLGFVSGDLAGQVVPLPSNGEVGRSPAAHVAMNHEPVGYRHAQLYLERGIHHVVDLDSGSGTYVDGRRLASGEAVRLQRGSLVTFGEGGPLAVYDAVDDLRRGSQQPSVTLRRNDAPGGSWALEGPAELGRGSSCSIQLDPERDSLASSRHLHLLPAFGRLVATDLGSANGTWHEGERLVQGSIGPGQSFLVGGEGGPSFNVEECEELPSYPSCSIASGLPSIPEVFWLLVSAGGSKGRIDVATKIEASFGSFAGLTDFETVCFPRDLETEDDSFARSEEIGPQHGSFVLTNQGMNLRDDGYAPTKLNGQPLPPQSSVPLPKSFQIALAGDALSLRGRLHSTANLQPVAPTIGLDGQHPVECLTLERMGDAPDSRLYLQLIRQATIGSDDEASIQIAAPGVAPLHALLYLSQDALWVSQLGDAPVAVNGTPLSPGTGLPVGLGCEFYVGTAVFRVREQD
jgi:pSer/pThr/pTyr-binding forkhead associated (FHA) protein